MSAETLRVQKIWDHAPHNAFTDLIRYGGRWFCAFREGESHVDEQASIRVLVSNDGDTWHSAALIGIAQRDLRDAKLCQTPDGRLMLNTCCVHREADKVLDVQTLAYFSVDGCEWGSPHKIGDNGYWLWRTDWHKGVAYSLGYKAGEGHHIRLFRSDDGIHFDVINECLLDEHGPSEYAFVFLEDDTCLCLLRRDDAKHPGCDNALLGQAQPPYKNWQWQELDERIGGPDMLQLPDGRILAGVRKFKDNCAKDWRAQWTELSWLDRDNARLMPCVKLPSGGDSSYPGMVFYDGEVWVSYYSSHEEKTAIYLARIVL